MKFSVAAGFLVQTLPALSLKADILTPPEQRLQVKDIVYSAKGRPNSQGLLQHHSKTRALHARRSLVKQSRRARNVAGVLENLALCDPAGTDADTGILSCGEGRTCVPNLGSELGGICIPRLPLKDQSATKEDMSGLLLGQPHWTKHVTTVPTDLVQCDPTVVDIGILACEEGKICKKDKASELGGFCLTVPSYSRQLETVALCDSASPDFNAFCDCTGLEPTSGTGDIVCLLAYNYRPIGCDDLIYSAVATYTYQQSYLIYDAYCLVVTSPYYQTLCQFYDSQSDSCLLDLNDQPCNTCSVSFYDCSNVQGGASGVFLDEVLPIFSQCSTVVNVPTASPSQSLQEPNFPSETTGTVPTVTEPTGAETTITEPTGSSTLQPQITNLPADGAVTRMFVSVVSLVTATTFILVASSWREDQHMHHDQWCHSKLENMTEPHREHRKINHTK